jgi:hypothetical protein
MAPDSLIDPGQIDEICALAADTPVNESFKPIWDQVKFTAAGRAYIRKT